MTKIELIGQIADMKEVDYKTSLLLSGLIELLVENDLIDRRQLIAKTHLLDFLDELQASAKK